MKKDKYGYVIEGGHPVFNEHNNAITAWNISGGDKEQQKRIQAAEEAIGKLQQRIEDRLRKDLPFLEIVALLAECDNRKMFEVNNILES